jgi:hypothetical protein
MTLACVQSVGLPGFDGPVHQLLVTRAGRLARVSALCRHAEAERVLYALGGSEVDCERPSAVLEYALRRGCSLDEGRLWAGLPVDPRKPHPLYRIKVPHRRWDLIDLDDWLNSRRSPQDVAERCIFNTQYEGRLR